MLVVKKTLLWLFVAALLALFTLVVFSVGWFVTLDTGGPS